MKAISLILVFSLVFIIGCEEKNTPPTCDIISPGNGEEYYVSDTITISVEAEDEDGINLEVRFYIDDIGIASTSTFPFNYEWDTEGEAEGSKDIKVTVKDDKGGSAQDEISIFLNPKGEPPVASFTADTTWIILGEYVQFIDQSTNEPTSWLWNFGDENTSTDQNPTHTYTKTGSYTVELTVTNHFGFDSEAKTHYIIVIDSIETDIFTDPRDGKTYKTVKIGTQTWMAENLKATKYNDGTDIPLATEGNEWGRLITPAYCWYDNDESTYGDSYGPLYNWYTVETGNLCPAGWHVPTDEEWKTLEMHLGMSQAEADDTGFRGTDEGGKLKETGTTHWNSPNEGATNESGFSALPGGIRLRSGNFYAVGLLSDWWSATEGGTSIALTRRVGYDFSGVNRGGKTKDAGLAVRCLRD